jgi:thioredoxin 1
MTDSLVQHITDDTFESEVLHSAMPVLVDYWAEWCGPCQMIAPLLDQVAADYADKVKIVKVDVDDNQATAAKYGIRGIPTLMIFQNGELKTTKTGAVSKQQLTTLINTTLGI